MAAVHPECLAIGLGLVWPEHVRRLAEYVQPEHFSQERAVYWRAMLAIEQERPGTGLLPAVARRLEHEGGLNPDVLADLLRCCQLQDRLYTTPETAAEALLADHLEVLRRTPAAGDKLEERLAQVQELSSRIAALRGDHDIESTLAITDQLIERLTGEAVPDPRACKWGLLELDDLTGGLAPGKLWLVGGRPGEGKSALVAHVAAWAIQNFRPVLYVSLEMGPAQCHERLCCALAGVSTEDRYRTPAARFALRQTAEQLRGAPILYRTLTSVDAICALARQIARTQQLSLVVVDYLQLVDASKAMGKNAQRYQQVGDVSKRLKNLAEELQVVVLCAALVGRGVGKPGLASFRESGNIEADMDGGVIIYYGTEGIPAFQVGQAVEASLIVPKNRGGAIGECKAQFRREYTRWENVAHPWQQARGGAEDDGL